MDKPKTTPSWNGPRARACICARMACTFALRVACEDLQLEMPSEIWENAAKHGVYAVAAPTL